MTRSGKRFVWSDEEQTNAHSAAYKVELSGSNVRWSLGKIKHVLGSQRTGQEGKNAN